MGLAMERRADGSLSPARPVPMGVSDIDFEVYEFTARSGWEWHAYLGGELVGTGRAKTRAGLFRSITWNRRRLRARHGITA